ncbi:hypothetical protein L596_004801 [Steinernema carpocapsae]|uniref:Uncharacterized protein n=1 Tax=Steinernema carpocapsae TaxID=34508 RepID=A0A4U8V140_STECR|nr:hypothetical protein L596_004801 [Steinernema carpocapsae]
MLVGKRLDEPYYVRKRLRPVSAPFRRMKGKVLHIDNNYSLLSTLKFATCSHTSDESRSTLVPDLSFFDTTFSDILYFVDETSVGPIWTLRQFQMLKSGYLKPLDIYDITHPAFDSQKLDAYAKDNLVHTDGKSLYIWSRSKDTFHSTCAFNMIFRPKLAKTKAFKVQRHPREWLNSFSVDKSLIVYAESSRSSDFRWDTRIFAGDLRKSNETVCIGQSNVLVDLNVVSVASLLEMTHKDFSLFGNRTSQKTDVISNAEASKTTMASSLLRTSSTTVAKMPSSRTGQNRSNKSEDYDYSNSIFSNDLGYIINLGNFKTPETGASSKTKPSTNGADLGGLGDPERTVNNDRRVTSPEVSRPTPTTATPKSPTTPSATFQTDLTVSESGKITSDHQQNHYEIPTITTTEQPTPLKIDPVHDTSSSQDKMVNEVPSTLIGKSVILSLLSAAFSHILVAQI